ncbi:MAG: histidinol-phosphatase [Spirochaetia bacterium]|nr:histidinol-phosphatase [Spirochaetia bacterium]
MLFSYHTHTEFCDGRASAASMAHHAHQAGYSYLGFSSHAPLPFDTNWNMRWERLGDYAATIGALKNTYDSKGMTILLGLEIDYIENLVHPSDSVYDRIQPEFRLGSVHYITPEEGEAFTVDENSTDFAQHVKLSCHGDHSILWKQYYRNLTAMIEKGGFDIIAHFDIVRKNNQNGMYFDEDSPAYLEAAFEAIDMAASKDIVAEINTGGIARGKTLTPYPSMTLLKHMRARNVRITIGDDAHGPSHLGAYQQTAREWAKAAGYSSFFYLKQKGEWAEIGID